MSEVLACRVCLATDVKLLNIFKYRLEVDFENLTGLVLSETDKLKSICSYCSALMVKSALFKQTCLNSQELIKFVELQQHELSTDYVKSLKLESSFPLTRNDTEIFELNTELELKEDEQDFKEEYLSWESENEQELSDEEPLSTKVKETEDFKEVIVEILDSENRDFVCPDIETVYLTKEQQFEEIESRKMSMNYLNGFYKCDYCYKGFMTEATYKNHMIRHDPKTGPHECDICKTRWPNVRLVRKHSQSSHERKFFCRLCDSVTKSKEQAKQHSKWHRGHMFVCKHCGASFAKSTSHLTHLRMQHPSEHICEICGESFIGEKGLKMHRKKIHWDVKEDHGNQENQCAQCNINFKTTEALKKHVDSEKCNTDVKACVQCGEGFNSEEEFKEHLKEHTKKEPFKCPECPRCFLGERALAIHRRSVHTSALQPRSGTRRQADIVCEVCGKKCFSNSALRYHQRVHTGDKPYPCTICPKAFTCFTNLQIHHRTHTGERPYRCSRCPKAFKHKAALNRHDRVHTGAKPYTCSHCGKSFSQSNSLKGHIKSVHLKLPSPYRPRKVPVD